MKRNRLILLLAMLVTLTFAVRAADDATDYPNRPIRLIVPQSPGSATDVLVRLFAPRLGDALGQAIVIDNRAGAGGIIGAEAAAKSPADGYTLLVGATAWINVAPHTYKKVGYDPITDFVPVSLFAVGDNLLVVNPALGPTNVRELLELMRVKPNQINMASAGVGSSSHLAGIMLTTLAGVNTVHVPYKGAGPSVVSVIAGESQWTFTPMQGPLAQVRAGKLRALAVGGSERSPALPDVPTVAESGLPEYFSTTWYGILAPRGTAPALVDKLHSAIVKTVASPEAKAQILNQGAAPKTNSPAEFAQFVKLEFERIGKAVKAAGVTAD